MPRRLAPLAVATAVLSLALSACGEAARTGAQPAGSPSAQASPSPEGSATSPPATPPPPAPGPGGAPAATRVVLTRTGGIAGVMQQVEIAPDGSWTYTDKRTGHPERGQLDAAQRAELARMVADPALVQEARQRPGPGVCNDAFVYRVTVGELSFGYEQ